MSRASCMIRVRTAVSEAIASIIEKSPPAEKALPSPRREQP